MRGRIFAVLLFADLDPPSDRVLIRRGLLDLCTSEAAQRATGLMLFGKERPDDLPANEAPKRNGSRGELRVIPTEETLEVHEDIAEVVESTDKVTLPHPMVPPYTADSRPARPIAALPRHLVAG